MTGFNSSLADVTATILAGGLGTRLRPVMADRPKVLADVLGRPFLTFLLDHLQAAGVRRVVLCTGYKGEQVQAAFGDSYGSLCLAYSHESSPLGTGGALRAALPLFEADSILVMNGDSFCETDLRVFWNWHCAREADATLLLTKVSDTTRYGRVVVDAHDHILRFDEKAPGTGPGWINAGIYLISRTLVQTIPRSRAVSLERETFPAWIGQGFCAYPSEGRFLDIGTPEAYAAADLFFGSPHKPIRQAVAPERQRSSRGLASG